MASRLMTEAEYRDYQDGSHAGAGDFSADAAYRPEPGTPMFRQGYCDGWIAAASGAVTQEVTR